jgi:hypothetical protein
MLTVVWSPHGFHLIDVLPKGSKFLAGHYISHIISPLPEILAPYQDDRRRHFVIHRDNARPYCVKTVVQFLDHNSLRRATHPLYSPDLLPQTSGFSGIWKQYFKGVHSMNLMNSCPLSRKFWRESSLRLWTRYFKNGWSDCKMYWWNREYVEWCLNWNVQFLFLNGRSWEATLRWNIAFLQLLIRKDTQDSSRYQGSCFRQMLSLDVTFYTWNECLFHWEKSEPKNVDL